MVSVLHFSDKHFLPTQQEVVLARESSKILADYARSAMLPALRLVKKHGQKEELTLPLMALRLLAEILSEMAKGNAVTLIPVHAELTTQEAADLLNVSRPFLINLLEENKIPYRKIGSKRRIQAKDILEYKTKIEQSRMKVLDQLSAQAQELDMGYVSKKSRVAAIKHDQNIKH